MSSVPSAGAVLGRRSDFGPFFVKFCTHFPYNAKLCLNGHHWIQRQAAKAGIGYTAMDNAFGCRCWVNPDPLVPIEY